MTKKIKVVHFGLGVIGIKIVEEMLSLDLFEIVGAIDIDKEKVGKDLGTIMNLRRDLGIIISNNPDKIFSEKKVDIVIHATQSYVKQVYSQLESIIKKGINIVSTCEELSNPYRSSPNLSKKIDNLAKQYDVTVLATGINPGFLMDYLPLILTGPVKKIDKIEVIRQINASNRRLPFQKKIG